MIPGATGGAVSPRQSRTYEQQLAKINEFFDRARQYQKEREVKAPGFKTGPQDGSHDAGVGR